MRRLFLLLFISFISACTKHALDDHYACSYETTDEAYETCMAVERGAKEDTANKAGK